MWLGDAGCMLCFTFAGMFLLRTSGLKGNCVLRRTFCWNCGILIWFSSDFKIRFTVHICSNVGELRHVAAVAKCGEKITTHLAGVSGRCSTSMYRSSDLFKTHLWCLLLGIRLDSPSWRHVFLEQLPPGICLSVSRTDGMRALVKICWTGQVLLSALCSRSRFLQEVLLGSLLTRYCLHCSASSKSLLSWNGPVVGVLPPARLQRMNLRLTTSATKP